VSENQVTEQKQNLAELGDGEVFVKRTNDGFIKAVKGVVKLSEQKGHLAEIQGKVMITAAGFYELNKISGLSIITPDKLTLPEGKVVVNPYPIIDPESGSISKVWVKKMGVGYSPIGNLVITSSTLLYDIRMYFVQDLVKKIKKDKSAGKIVAEHMLTADMKEKGIFQKIEGDIGVWANFEHYQILKALETFVQNKLFAERKAQTVCERNVLKKHPALSQVYVTPQGPEKSRQAAIPIVGWTHDLSQDELIEIAEEAANVDEGEVEVAGQKVEVVDVGGEITDEEIMAALEDDENIGGDEDDNERGTY